MIIALAPELASVFTPRQGNTIPPGGGAVPRWATIQSSAVTVNAVPAVVATSGVTTSCMRSSVVCSSAVPGGRTSSGTATWKPSENASVTGSSR